MSAWSTNATSCTTHCDVTVAMLPNGLQLHPRMGQSPIQTVPACPVQIRAHHRIDVYTDINNTKINISFSFNITMLCTEYWNSSQYLLIVNDLADRLV